jgi:hypothetical protein
MHGCCKNVNVAQHIEIIDVDKYSYRVTIHYCSNCGSLKTTTNLREINGN